MKSSRTRDFRQKFAKLPSRIQETAKKNYQLWKQNPFHPSLEFKEVKPKENIWSVRIGIGWRALGVMKADNNKIVWFWVGSHADYVELNSCSPLVTGFESAFIYWFPIPPLN